MQLSFVLSEIVEMISMNNSSPIGAYTCCKEISVDVLERISNLFLLCCFVASTETPAAFEAKHFARICYFSILRHAFLILRL